MPMKPLSDTRDSACKFLKTSFSAAPRVVRYQATITAICLFLMAFACAIPVDAMEKGARSVHLWWHPGANASAFYNEIKVEKSSNGSYFCVCGFNHGYFGLQQLLDGNKIVIFSVWDPGNPFDFGARSTDVRADQQVKVLYTDPAVRTQRFGGEGTGQQSFFQFPWELGRTYKFAVTAKRDHDRTAYAAHIFDPRINRWRHLATFSTLANEDLIKGAYSFDEDFRRDEYSRKEERLAYFSNGALLVPPDQDRWQPLTSATFSASKDDQTNIDAWADNYGIGLATGGCTQNRHARLQDKIESVATSGYPPRLSDLN